MTSPDNLKVIAVPQLDPRLGRNVCHDPRSREHAAPRRLGTAKRRSVSHRIYDPRPNPNQQIGLCTCCAEMMMANSADNRVKGTVLGMTDAEQAYRIATQLDPFPGAWEPDDTGSDGLSAAKAAVQLGIGSRYEWYFGLDAVLDGLQQYVLSAGTWWYEGLFLPDPGTKLVRPTGAKVGGHQYALRGHDVSVSRLAVGKQHLIGRCWWGADWQDFRITVDDFAELLADDGDVHRTIRVVA